MNIFVTNEDPVLCAQALDDKRVGKLLMEANQMLSLAVKFHCDLEPNGTHTGPEKLTAGLCHLNHPVSIWVRQTRGNFDWTVSYARALAAEFEHRFGKEHASACRTDFIIQFADNVPNGDLQPFQNSAKNSSLGIDFSMVVLVTEAYRQYLLTRWANDARIPKWTNRGEPSWYLKLDGTMEGSGDHVVSTSI